VCLRRELKASRYKSYPNGDEDDELIIVVGLPMRHLWRQDDATVLDIVVVEHATYRVLMTLGWAVKRSAPRAH
jgi:hypothetical protein